jgi:hypothetical protein
MTTIVPDSAHLKQAVEWISDQRKEDESTSIKSLINNAIIRFDLNPKQSEFLINFYKNK